MFAIGVQLVPLVDDSHLTTDPVWVPRVSKVLFVFVHTVVPPVTAPDTVEGSTVTVTVKGTPVHVPDFGITL